MIFVESKWQFDIINQGEDILGVKIFWGSDT